MFWQKINSNLSNAVKLVDIQKKLEISPLQTKVKGISSFRNGEKIVIMLSRWKNGCPFTKKVI